MRHHPFHPKQRAVPIVAHYIGLRALFPQGVIQRTDLSVSWEGLLKPTPDSRTYRIRLDYTLGKLPNVRILSPDLRVLAGSRKLPHTYDQKDQRICLFYPDGKYWRPQMSVAVTMMTWTLAWLAFFELWLLTDVWYGRGIGHPGDDSTCHNL
jgi:hypothetical protein